MPSYLDIYTLSVLWPLFGLIVLVALVYISVHRAIKGVWIFNDNCATAKITFLACISFAVLGVTAGFMTGLSRAPVVGAVIPAVLSLVAGLGVFLTARANNTGTASMVCGPIAALAFTILVSSIWGANERGHTIRVTEAISRIRHDPEYLVRQAELEAYVRSQREDLGLPSDPPVTPWP